MGRVSPLYSRGLGLRLLGACLLLVTAPLPFSANVGLQPGLLSAQNSCDLADSRSWRFVARGTPAETHWFTRALFVCQDGSRIYSDSAIISPPQRLSQLFGNVSFTEEGRRLTANRADYRTDIDRLDAFGDVVLVDSAGGSRIEGENLVYLRSGEARVQDQLTVTGVPGQRPRAVIVPRPTPRDPPAADTLSPDSVPADRLPVEAVTTDSAVVDIAIVDTVVGDSAAAIVEDSIPPDSARQPYTVVADRIVIVGEESFRGEGNAEVERGALKAYGNNMTFSEQTGELLMAGDARSEGDGYELSGQAITVLLPGDVVREIIARRQAALLTDDLDLTAPKIRIFVDDEALQRLVASQLREEDGPAFAEAVGEAVAGPARQPGVTEGTGVPARDSNRAVAVGQEFTLVGDSLDIETPDQELEVVHAVGRARAESYARDSLNIEGTPEIARHDWIEGDTLVATFTSKPAGDSPPADEFAQSTSATGDFVLDQLVASGSARSLYRMESNDSTRAGPKPLAIHYVLGNEITIAMREGEIDEMAVSGETRGFHFEPRVVAGLPDTVLLDTLGVGLESDTLIMAVDSLGSDTLVVDTLIVDTLVVDTLPVGAPSTVLTPDEVVDTISAGGSMPATWPRETPLLVFRRSETRALHLSETRAPHGPRGGGRT